MTSRTLSLLSPVIASPLTVVLSSTHDAHDNGATIGVACPKGTLLHVENGRTCGEDRVSYRYIVRNDAAHGQS